LTKNGSIDTESHVVFNGEYPSSNLQPLKNGVFMSTNDDKTNAVSEEPAGEHETPPLEVNDHPGVAIPEPQTVAPTLKNNSLGFLILFFILGLAASLVVGWVIFPKFLYSQKTQPIDFNHVLHEQEVANSCESCHFFRSDGTFSGVPKLEQCLECHEEQVGQTANEAKFFKNYVSKGVEVPWLVYSRQPDSVFFSHVAHIKKAKLECITCHGPIGQSEHLKVYAENRITGYSRDIWGKNIAGLKKNPWDRMKMDDCEKCHARKTEESEGSDLERPALSATNKSAPAVTKGRIDYSSHGV
jgi:hypothetical protein